MYILIIFPSLLNDARYSNPKRHFPFSITFHPYINYPNCSFIPLDSPLHPTFPSVSSFTYLFKLCIFIYEHTYLTVRSSFIFKKPSNRLALFSLWLFFPFGSYLHCAATSSKTYLSDLSFVRDLISARLSLLTPNYPQHIYVCFIQLY